VLNSALDIELSSTVQKALNRGASLSFMIDFGLSKPPGYWFDEKTAERRREFKLSCNALARQAPLRIRPDASRLPTLFQLGALASREWELSSDWYRFPVLL